MQIGKIYVLSCYADYGMMQSPFFGTKEKAINYLDGFQEKILEENDGSLKVDTQIELLEIDLEQIDDIEKYAHPNIVSTWKECQEEDFLLLA